MEKRSESDMTREEKVESLHNWCGNHACEPKLCRIYDICHQYPGSWREQPDEVIDTVFEALWACNVDIHNLSKVHIVNPQCEVNMFDGDNCQGWVHRSNAEINLKKAEEQLGMEIHLDKDQAAKADAWKAEIRLVPMEIVWAIAWIRMYGNHKYGDPDNWKTVEPERYRDAMMRHLLAYISDPKSVDEESGYPHLWHAACNMAFLMHFDYGDMTHHDYAKKAPVWEEIGKAMAEGAYEGGKHEYMDTRCRSSKG